MTRRKKFSSNMDRSEWWAFYTMKSDALKRRFIGIPINHGSLPLDVACERILALELGRCLADGFHLAQPDNDLVPTRYALGRQNSKDREGSQRTPTPETFICLDH
jgi:hypothetical protein